MEQLNTEMNLAKVPGKQQKYKRSLVYIKQNYDLYLLLLPTLVYVVVFLYLPMYGIKMAFQDFDPIKGFGDSPWVGLKHFLRFFGTYKASEVIGNTVWLSFYSLIAGFPFPIILALLLNNIPSKRYCRLVQTITYMPNFISIMVLVGMMNIFLSPNHGIVNSLLSLFGVPARPYMAEPSWFRHLYVWSGIWQGTGYGSIIYFAALSGIDTSLYEAATLDGASRLQRIRYIDIPSILPTCIIMLILSFGGIMSIGFEKVYLMQNSRNIVVSEIISTYVYKVGLIDGRFSFSAAVGLFNTVINFVILATINGLSKKLSEHSLW